MSQIIDLFGDGPTATDAAFLHILQSPQPRPKEAKVRSSRSGRKPPPI